MTKLNPCPNCGSEPEIAFYENTVAVSCANCSDNSLTVSKSASGAINAWNAIKVRKGYMNEQGVFVKETA